MLKLPKMCLLTAVLFAATAISCSKPAPKLPEQVTISKDVLMDKIKGGWAGQTIGCTYGGPTEFKYKGTMIQDYTPIAWNPGCIKRCMINGPGLYDDVYMDLTFVEVFDKLGIDAPADSFAVAFANAGYTLWHANQAARFNILRGIMPPESGHWLNNPHADDIDYQIEADFAGLMAPGMPNSACEISDRIGHIMNYGDGWYGGVYVGAMYSLAFVLDDVEAVVGLALDAIPAESLFHRCIADVIAWHKQFPDDWKRTWFECQNKYGEDIGCPDGVFSAYDIDATINSAYVVIGLLYGGGDFGKTMEISMRCGQDSDCNPATAAGILGTMIGYSNIPEKWMCELREAEDIDFAFTDISLARTYQMSFDQALQMIERCGGEVRESDVVLCCQQPQPVRLEQCFEGLRPVSKKSLGKKLEPEAEFDFEGAAFVLRGTIKSDSNDYCAEIEVSVDGAAPETMRLPVDFVTRSQEMYWNYSLAQGAHHVCVKLLNPAPGASVSCGDLFVYEKSE